MMKLRQVEITRVEGPSAYCGKKHVFNSFRAANLHIESLNSTYPKEGYDKHKFSVLFEDENLRYDGVLCIKHPENELFRTNGHRINEHMIAVLETEITVDLTTTEEYRQEVLTFVNIIKEVYQSESNLIPN